MRNIVIAVVSLFMVLFLISCEVEEPIPENSGPTYHELTVPKGHKLMNIECGRPCIITFDTGRSSYVVQYVDGSTLTVHFAAAL